MAPAVTSPTQTRHEQAKNQSYKLLERARETLVANGNGNHQKLRDELARLLEEKFKHPPYKWQLDVAEAICLGLDSVVIAGTGEGKTLPFVMLLLLDKEKKVVIISPLIALQEDHVERFNKMNIPAVAVNKDSWTGVRAGLEANEYRAILTSPEMALGHAGFRKILSSTEFSKNVVAYVVDECHCISQWGGDFRTTYRRLNELRAFVPENVPILATSATLTPDAIADTRRTLGIDDDACFFLNLGNHRPNLHFSAFSMKGLTDLPALARFFSKQIKTALDISQTIIFTDDRARTQEICAFIRSLLPPELQDTVAFLNALKGPRSKRQVMEDFRNGKIRILVATEAAGMGCDIPHIARVIQFGIPKSLSVWLQRAGRAGRSREVKAEAILLYEESALRIRKRKCAQKQNTSKKRGAGRKGHTMKGKSANEEPSSVSENEESGAEQDDSVGNGEDGITYQKNIDPVMRKWIEACDCRAIVTDNTFDNPPRQQRDEREIGDCCDNCDRKIIATAQQVENNKRPAEDVENDVAREKKRAKTTQTRVSAVQAQVVSALNEWRRKTKMTHYPTCSFSAAGILPDYIISRLSTNAKIMTVDELLESCGDTRVLATKHGDEVLAIIHGLDEAHKNDIAARNEQRKRQTALKNEQRQLVNAIERERRRQQEQWERLMKKTPKTRQRAPKTPTQPHAYPLAVSTPPPLVPSTPSPLVGSSTFNVVSHMQAPSQLHGITPGGFGE